jgi:hypothetical protein
MFAAAQPLLLRFPLDRAIFLREYATNSYGAIPYFLSKSMVELPQSLMQSIITWLAVYWLMGFHGSILVFILVFWLTGLAAASTALLVGCLATNPEVAQQVSPAIFVPQLLFAGERQPAHALRPPPPPPNPSFLPHSFAPAAFLSLPPPPFPVQIYEPFSHIPSAPARYF